MQDNNANKANGYNRNLYRNPNAAYWRASAQAWRIISIFRSGWHA